MTIDTPLQIVETYIVGRPLTKPPPSSKVSPFPIEALQRLIRGFIVDTVQGGMQLAVTTKKIFEFVKEQFRLLAIPSYYDVFNVTKKSRAYCQSLYSDVSAEKYAKFLRRAMFNFE